MRIEKVDFIFTILGYSLKIITVRLKLNRFLSRLWRDGMTTVREVLGRGLVCSFAANQPPPQSYFNRKALSF